MNQSRKKTSSWELDNTMGQQILDVLSEFNEKNTLVNIVDKKCDKLTTQFEMHCKNSSDTFRAILDANEKTSSDLDYIKENMATMPEVRDYVDQHYKLKKLKAYEDGEISTVFHLNGNDTPMRGNVAVKTEDSKSLTAKAVMISTSIVTGVIAGYMILKEFLFK